MNPNSPPVLFANRTEKTVRWSLPDLFEEGSRFCYYLMHLAWLLPWMIGLLRHNRPGSAGLVFVLIVGITWAADFLAREMALLRIKKKIRWVALGLYVAISVSLVLAAWDIFISRSTGQGSLTQVQQAIQEITRFSEVIPGEFVVAVFVLLNILHGVRQAHDYIGPPSLIDGMLWGVLGFVAYGVIVSRVNGDNPAGWFFVFISSLVGGLFFYRLADYSRRARSSQRAASNRWRFGLLVGIFAFLGLSGILASLAGANLALIRELASVAAINIFFVLSWPFLGLLAIFEWLAGPYLGGITLPKTQIFEIKMRRPELPPIEGPDGLDRLILMLGTTLKPFMLWGILIVITIIILRVALHSKPARRSGDDRFESLVSLEEVPRDLANRLRNQFSELVQRLLPKRVNRRRLAAERIRQIYSAWLGICAEKGIERLEAQTPAEHAEIAAGAFPALRTDIHLLVDAYHQVRYGEMPEHPEELSAVEQAWKRLRLMEL